MRKMSFQLLGCIVCWLGAATTSVPIIQTMIVSESLLDELLDCFRDVFAEPKGYHICVPTTTTSSSNRACDRW